jgi:glycosyltransferase involved in cell wall biosynthesis
VQFILAMGRQGVEWYRKCRFPESRIYPFAYVTEANVGRVPEATPPRFTGDVTVAFLGQMIHRKGGDVLLRALASQPDRNWRLRMTGEGESRPSWERLASQLGISDRVTFTGAVPNEEGRALVGSADFLVLPSRFDGWGAVANEALMQGVPVLCSDRCGARDLLAETWRGEIFKAGSVEGLRDALARWINRGKRTPDLTRRIKGWSRCLGGESVADYFAAVLRHVYECAPRPIAPWLCNGSEDN